jgi:hypothetical protein
MGKKIARRILTGAERMVVHSELLAGLKVFALCVYAAEVVAVVLPAGDRVSENSKTWRWVYQFLVWFWLGKRASKGAVRRTYFLYNGELRDRRRGLRFTWTGRLPQRPTWYER